MLKGKKGIYILIPLNVLIWGFFIYRFYSLYNENTDTLLDNSSTAVKIEDVKDMVIYKLNLAYDDPFLKAEPKARLKPVESKLPEKPKEQKVERKKVKEEPKPIPDIKYLGLVKNNANGLSTAIVSINGSSKLIKQDEVIEGMCFKNFTSENLTVFWNKEKIIISK